MGVDARADVRISLLGGFAASIDCVPVDDRWRLRKAKTLVKLLCLATGHRLHRDTAVELMWPDADQSAAANNLHQAVHAARRVLGAGRIALRDDVLYLCPDDVLVVDVDAFRVAAERARSTGELDELRAALAIWTGPLLPEDVYESWCAPYRERLTETHAALTTALATRLVDAGEPAAALAVAEPLAAERPLDERLQRARIAALRDLDRRWDAIAAYENLRAALDDEYAVEPQAPTKALYRQLLLGVAAPHTRTPHNLPEPTSSFIGRRRELHELATSLERTRLLTLTGPGGAGKSRLSLELARRIAATADYPDGVWRVELAGVKEGEVVTSTAAAALGLALPGGRPSEVAVADQLAGRSLVIVLDNCEHLLASACTLVTEVLSRCPDVRFVTTSREPLAVAGEVVYRVPSLELPARTSGESDIAELAGLESVQLFVERARQTAPRFELTADNVRAVTEICHRLDGMPLALELAAARLAHLTVTDLEAGLGNALTLLARRGGTRLDRQQTLAATLDWSHDLLDDGEQIAFRRLAAFAGGFGLDAAASVCAAGDGAAIDLISRLVDKSLVEADTSGSSARYRLLEVVRQYADARLHDAGEAPDVLRRHREWFAAAAAEQDPDRGAAVVGEPSLWFDVEQDNLRVALSSGLADDPALAMRLATSTWRFWAARGLIAEGARWLTLALERCADRSSVRARALAALAVLHVRQGRVAELTAIGDEIVDLLDDQDDPAELAFAHHERALLAFMSGDWSRAAAGIDADGFPDVSGHPAITASATHLAGVVALNRGELTAARTLFLGALDTVRRVPARSAPRFHALTLAWIVDQRGEIPLMFGEETLLLGRRVGAEQAAGHIQLARALTERLCGDLDAALRLIDAAQAAFAQVGDQYGSAYAAAQKGHTLRWAGAYDAAEDSLAHSEAIRRELRDQRSVAMALAGRAAVAAAAGHAPLARSRGLEAVQMMQRSGDTPGVALTSCNLAIDELLLGEFAAALEWLRPCLELPDIPGGHRAFAWMRLLQAHLLSGVGDQQAASDAADVARRLFSDLGEQAGLAALQRACKVGRLRLPIDTTA